MPFCKLRKWNDTRAYGIAKNALKTTLVISRELDFSDFRPARIFSVARRTVSCPSRPIALVLLSPAIKKKVHPTLGIFRSIAYPSRPLNDRQPGENGSLSNVSPSGKSVPSLKRTVPALIVSPIGILLRDGPSFHRSVACIQA